MHRSETSWKTIKADFDVTTKCGFTYFGFGGSPIHNDKIRLSLLGTVGLGNPGAFLMGADADFVYRINNHFGVYGDVGFLQGFFGDKGTIIPIKAGVSFTL